MRIRPAAPADLPAWDYLRRQLWPDADSEDERREMLGYLADPTWFVAVAEVDGTLVGFAEAHLRECADGCDTSPVGYLEGWFVAEGYRQRGIGAALVRAVEDWARARGCTELASDAELTNVGSQQAHAALGFEEVERVVLFRKSL